MNTALAPDWLPNFLVPFLTLSYPTATPAAPDSFPDSSYYNAGPLDACLVITMIAVMAVLRDAARLAVLEPFARWKLTRDLTRERAARKMIANGNGAAIGNGNGSYRLNGNGKANGNGHAGHAHAQVTISKREAGKMHHSVLRFAEQGYAFFYYTCQWTFGVYVHRALPTSVLNPIDVWLNYPHISLAGPLKFYYLSQAAFYLHQILVINAEARRKDHWQMMAHHVITVALMIGSYSYHCTRVGCLVMMLMDLSDIFFPLAKMFRYLSLSTLCDMTFVTFMLSWFVTRHVLFMLVIKSAYWDAPQLIPSIWDASRGDFMTKNVFSCFVALLIALQILQIMWFWMICRVAWRVVSGDGAEDTRSDSEDDGSPEDEAERKKDR